MHTHHHSCLETKVSGTWVHRDVVSTSRKLLYDEDNVQLRYQ